MTSSFDSIRPTIKFSNSSSYRNPVFENQDPTVPSVLFNADNRIPTWPWFYFNDASNSSAATAAAMAFSKLNHKKDEIEHCTNLNSIKHHHEKSSTLVPCSSKLESDITKFGNNWSSKDIFESSKDVLGKTNVTSSLPSSPFGTISTCSSPKSLENDHRGINQEKLMSPLGSPRQMGTIQVIKLQSICCQCQFFCFFRRLKRARTINCTVKIKFLEI
jgi:hypothetical protein